MASSSTTTLTPSPTMARLAPSPRSTSLSSSLGLWRPKVATNTLKLRLARGASAGRIRCSLKNEEKTSEKKSPDAEKTSEKKPEDAPKDKTYVERLGTYQDETGLADSIQTGVGRLSGIPVGFGVMEFKFMGGSMGSVVGEKITRIIEEATKEFKPLVIVCASGGARMQEGSLSLMQMAKISAALHDYQMKSKLFYVALLTSPTTGGVTASFAMLGDVNISEPEALIAFAGKRVIEQTLNITVPEGAQEAEPLFQNGLLDLIVPRNLMKGVISELFQLHSFIPLFAQRLHQRPKKFFVGQSLLLE